MAFIRLKLKNHAQQHCQTRQRLQQRSLHLEPQYLCRGAQVQMLVLQILITRSSIQPMVVPRGCYLTTGLMQMLISRLPDSRKVSLMSLEYGA